MDSQVFVARERELEQLNTFLNRALSGQGQVCFVTGEAGAGKTALVSEFARRAQAVHNDLVVAIGSCTAQIGIGDSYLPFREVLGMLTGDVEAELAHSATSQENAGRLQSFLRLSGRTLVEYGPDLVDIFVPGTALASRVSTALAQRAGWMDQLEALAESKAASGGVSHQSRIFEQYTAVLQVLAAQQPLLLILDDLHWVDDASVELLFHLARRLEEHRILIVGTYRPEDIALKRDGQRHPLKRVVNELKRHFGDVWVHLGLADEAEGRQFMDALLDMAPNRLGEAFRQALLQHTRGHPLFTTELLRAMRERGDLIRDAQGRWVAGPELAWDSLPARVDGVIEERIGRLEAELREALTIASVEGVDFTAQVVARVQQVDERGLVRRLSRELDKQHRLVGERGSRQVGPQRLYLFRFHHSLFQQHLYNGLGEIERELLHGDVGLVLEELYAERVEEIAPQLAWHFAEARQDDKAFAYHLLAGEVALRNYAYLEARQHYEKAEQWLSQVPTATVEQRLRLHQDLGYVYFWTVRSEESAAQYRSRLSLIEDHLDPEDPSTRRLMAQTQRGIAEAYLEINPEEGERWLEKAFQSLGAAQDRDSRIERAHLLHARAWLEDRRGAYLEQLDASGKALALAETLEEPLLEMRCCQRRILALESLNRWQEALEGVQRLRRINQAIGDKHWEYEIQLVLGYNYLGLGELAKSREAFANVLRIAQSRGYDLAYPKWQAALVYLEGGDFDEAERLLVEVVAGMEGWLQGCVLSDLGTVYHRAGRLDEAEVHLSEGIKRWRASSVVKSFNFGLTRQAELYLDLNRVDEAVETLQESRALSQEMHTPWVEGIAGRLMGRAYHLKGDWHAADRHLLKSIETQERLQSQVEHGRSLYEYGLLQQEKGSLEEARTLFEQARDIFAAKGAKYDLSRAEEALSR